MRVLCHNCGNERGILTKSVPAPKSLCQVSLFAILVQAFLFIFCQKVYQKRGDNNCKRNSKMWKPRMDSDDFFVRYAANIPYCGCYLPQKSKICLSNANAAERKVL